MEYKGSKISLFKKKINAPKAILDNIDNGELSIHDYINYNLKNLVSVDAFKEEYRNIINKIGIDNALNLNWNFVDENIMWVNSILDKYDTEYSDYMDFIYAMAYNDIVIDRNRNVLYSKNMDIEFKKRFPQIFLDSKVNNELQNNYYNYKLTIKDYVDNLEVFNNKYVTHVLYAGDFFKNILKNINDENLNEFIKDNKELTKILLDDESALLNIIALYQSGLSEKDKKEIFRNFINISNLKITTDSIKVLKKYFTLDEIISGSSSTVKKLIHKYGLDKLEKLNINIHDVPDYLCDAIELFGINNIIKFNDENNNFLKKDNYEVLSAIYLKIKHNLSYLTDNIDETLYNLFCGEYFDYRNIGDNFKNKYLNLFLEDNAPTELKDLYYSNSLTGSILQENRNYIKYLIDKNNITGFRIIKTIINDKEENLYEYLIDKIGSQETYNLIADYGYTFDNVFSNKLDLGIIKSKEDIFTIIENTVHKEILRNSAYNDKLPAKFMIKNKDLFLDIMVDYEFKELFYSKQLSFKYLYDNSKYIKYLSDKNLRAGFKNEYDIFDYFADNNVILKIISKYGDILENVKSTNFFDVLLKIISKKDKEINELIFNDTKLLNLLISLRDSNSIYNNYLNTMINALPKEDLNMAFSQNTSMDILNNFKTNNKNLELFSPLSLDAFNSFLEQNDNRFTPHFINLYNNQNDSNYKLIEDFVSFYLAYKFNKLESVFKNEFHLLLSKPNKTINDYVNICHYLRAIHSYKKEDKELLDRYNYGLDIIKLHFAKYGINEELLSELLENILNKKSSILNLKYINNNKKLKFALNVFDIYNNIIDEYIDNLNDEFVDNIDHKKFNYIFVQLSKLGFDNEELVNLSFIIYFSIGYDNATILFSKNKKTNFKNRIWYMFKLIDINSINIDVSFINNLLFNVDEFGVPINNYFDDFSELNKILDDEINEINSSTANDYDKSNRINSINNKVNIYKENLLDLFSKFHRLYNECDLINEFLEDNLDIVSINRLLNNLTFRRVPTILDDRDYLLIDTNHLNYVGFNNIVTNEYLKNLINYSRSIKKENSLIPNITVGDYDYILKTINVNEKTQFNLGFVLKSQFAIDGNDNTLFMNTLKDGSYNVICISKDDMIVCAIPVIRKGNILILDGLIYDTLTQKQFDIVINLLKQYTTTIINISKESEADNRIKCILLNNKNLLNIKNKLEIISNKECYAFDEIIDSQFIIQYILYKEDGYYDLQNQKSSYLQPNLIKEYESLLFEEKDLDNIYDLNSIKNRIILLANKRRNELKNNNAAEAYELFKEIKSLQDTYILKYNLLLESTGKDLLSIYNKAIHYITTINTILGKHTNDNKYKLLKYSNNWYIGITVDNQVCCAHLSSGKRQYTKVLGETMEEIKNSLTEEEKRIKAKFDKVKGDKNAK